jgi:hypothetical protein
MTDLSSFCARIYRTFPGAKKVCVAGLAMAAMCGWASVGRATVLLNDSLADGTRTSTNLPSESPDYVGISNGSGGSASVTAGDLKFVQGTSSEKLWTYFTSDNSAPNTSQPHNSVTQLVTGETLTSSMTFTIVGTIPGTSSTPSRDLHIGLFFDPTDGRVESDVNSDGGGTNNPWQDSTGYMVTIPINSMLTTSTNELQLGKRTINNTSLAGSTSAFAQATAGGSVLAWQSNTAYTVQMALHMVSSTQMNVTASILQGATLLSTVTDSDTGTAFGSTSISASGTLPGATSVYTNFDQMFFRMNSDAEAPEFDFSNFSVNLAQAPEPASIGIVGMSLLLGIRARRAKA